MKLNSIHVLSIFIVAYLTLPELYGQAIPIRYDHFTIKDGLSQNTVYSIAQDSMGFMWFGTQEGLNRFDGRTFKIFKDNPYLKGSIKGNFIYVLYLDKQNNFWIGTNKVLNKYDFRKETFLSFRVETNDAKDSCIIHENGINWKNRLN